VGYRFHHFDHRFLCALVGLCARLRALALRCAMGIETAVLLAVCVLLLVYLGYALLNPERF